MGLLDGKVAIVTGGGRGLGRAHATALAQAGARVVVNDVGVTTDGKGADTTPAQQVVDEIKKVGGEAIADFSDVSSWDGARSLIEKAIQKYGKLDILVNNVGITRDKMIFGLEEEDWDAVMKVHLKGQFAPTSFAARYWRDLSKKTGRPVGAVLIFTASEAGIYGNPSQGNYSSAKAGLTMLGIVAAKEMGRYGVRSFVLCPRARTRMSEAAFSQFKLKDGWDNWAPENVAPLVVYLSSDASSDLNGQVFVGAGGFVQVLKSWTVGGQITQDKMWTVEDLIREVPTMFKDLPKGPPGMPDLGVGR